MQNIESNLKTKKIYFPNLSCTRDENMGAHIEITNSIKVNYDVISKDEIKVTLIFNALSKNNTFEVNAIICGVFELMNSDIFDSDMKESLLKINTIAILLPYLRSQVILLTSQIGINPIEIPIINAELLYKTTL